LQNGLFYIDGKQEDLNNNTLSIPPNATHLVISTAKQNNTSFIDKPLLFTSTGRTKAALKNWSAYGLSQYTGFLNYENSFVISESYKGIQLDLGKVSYMAEVWVNDQPVGARLWAPFTFDITEHVRAGNNKIRIKVGNLYLNEASVNGDLNMFMYKKIRAASGMNKPNRKDFDAGLLGPVRLNLY
jgi:hypothetical protein